MDDMRQRPLLWFVLLLALGVGGPRWAGGAETLPDDTN
jgi:hypothetical protein